jgi:hypothetical protein
MTHNHDDAFFTTYFLFRPIWRTWDQYALGTNMANLGPDIGTHWLALTGLDWLESSQAKEILTRVKPENPWLDNQVKFICLEIFLSLILNRQKWRLRAKFCKLRLIRYYLVLKVAASKPDNFVSKLN